MNSEQHPWWRSRSGLVVSWLCRDCWLFSLGRTQGAYTWRFCRMHCCCFVRSCIYFTAGMGIMAVGTMNIKITG